MSHQEDINGLKAENLLLSKRVLALEDTVIELTRRLGKLENRTVQFNEEEIHNEPKEDMRKVTSVVVADSQRREVKASGLSFGDRKTIIYPCPNLDQVKETITSRNDSKPITPDTVIISSITNNIDKDSDLQIVEKVEKSIKDVNEVWPQAEVKVSEATPRADKSDEEIQTLNQKIKQAANKLKAVTIPHRRISKDDLRDDRHLKPESAFKLALDWKYAANPPSTWKKHPQRIHQNAHLFHENKDLKRMVSDLLHALNRKL